VVGDADGFIELDAVLAKLSRDEPLEINFDGAGLRVGGIIDRINWGKDRFRVIDSDTKVTSNEVKVTIR